MEILARPTMNISPAWQERDIWVEAQRCWWSLSQLVANLKELGRSVLEKAIQQHENLYNCRPDVKLGSPHR